ncbi:ribosomal-protein-alanine acetyltransferase [Burkholderia pseudomallei 1710b]|nr:ribosomal-protein-alanine acetyltransferase [Burkholderia pseudomallei 1710b]
MLHVDLRLLELGGDVAHGCLRQGFQAGFSRPTILASGGGRRVERSFQTDSRPAHARESEPIARAGGAPHYNVGHDANSAPRHRYVDRVLLGRAARRGRPDGRRRFLPNLGPPRAHGRRVEHARAARRARGARRSGPRVRRLQCDRVRRGARLVYRAAHRHRRCARARVRPRAACRAGRHAPRVRRSRAPERGRRRRPRDARARRARCAHGRGLLGRLRVGRRGGRLAGARARVARGARRRAGARCAVRARRQRGGRVRRASARLRARAGDRRERAAACAADRARRAARISRGTRRAGRSRGARVRARQGRADHRRAARRARGRRRPMSGVLMTDRYLAPMTDADLDEVVEIERAAYEFPWSRGNFEDSLRNGYFGVCMRHVTGVLVGYCVLMPVVDEMHLLNLCVAPVAQRSGVGLALLREAVRIARAERLDGVLLEVRPSNPRAIRLYERFGFVSVGRRRNYYPAKHRSREDAIVMRLALTKEGGAHGMD